MVSMHPRNPCNYMDYYSFTNPRWDGRLSWPGWLTHIGHLTHEVVTYQPEKVRKPKTDVLTTEPHRQLALFVFDCFGLLSRNRD